MPLDIAQIAYNEMCEQQKPEWVEVDQTDEEKLHELIDDASNMDEATTLYVDVKHKLLAAHMERAHRATAPYATTTQQCGLRCSM